MTIKSRRLPKAWTGWESVKSKYNDICDLFIAALLAHDSDVMRCFPHKKEEVTKQIITSKLKAIRLKAVDSGRKSAMDW